jgi:hypothetical protein
MVDHQVILEEGNTIPADAKVRFRMNNDWISKLICLHKILNSYDDKDGSKVNFYEKSPVLRQ